MELKQDIIRLFNNKTAGSSTLLNKLNRIIRNEAGNPLYLSTLIKQSRKQFKAFSIIQNYLDEIEKELNNAEALSGIFKYYGNYSEKINDKIFENGREYFLNVSRVLTFSNSSTISNFLKRLYNLKENLEVIITESRPKNEGRVLAKELLRSRIPVEFISDYSAASCIPSVDAVIIGADKILSNGNIANKTGSKALAILCRYYKKPFYVITPTSKQSDESIYLPDESDTGEIWKHSDKKLKIRNHYFEEVDKELITKLITD